MCYNRKKITIKDVLKAILLCIAFYSPLTYTFSAIENYTSWSDGKIIVMARSGSVAFTQNGPDNYINVPRHGELKNKNAGILTGEDSTVTILFSNGLSIYLQSESSMEISHFRQEQFISDEHDLTHEPSRSVSQIKLKFGTFTFSQRTINPTSKLILETPMATLTSHSEEFAIQITETSLECLVFDHNIIIEPQKSTIQEYIQKGQLARITENSRYSNTPIQIEPITGAREVEIQETFKHAKAISDRLYFKTLNEGNKWVIEPWFILPIDRIP